MTYSFVQIQLIFETRNIHTVSAYPQIHFCMSFFPTCCVGHVTIYVVAPERNGEITRGTEKRSCRFDSSIDSELKCD